MENETVTGGDYDGQEHVKRLIKINHLKYKLNCIIGKMMNAYLNDDVMDEYYYAIYLDKFKKLKKLMEENE